jgi:hypothetical protein
MLEQKLASDIAQDPLIAALPNEDDQTKAMNDKIGEKNLPFLNNTVGLEKRFLEEFYSHGISLYKLNENTNNWSKLQLATPYNPTTPNASNSVVPIPCNN